MPPRLPFGQVRNLLLQGHIIRRMSSQHKVYVTRPDVDDSGLELLRKRFVFVVATGYLVISIDTNFDMHDFAQLPSEYLA